MKRTSEDLIAAGADDGGNLKQVKIHDEVPAISFDTAKQLEGFVVKMILEGATDTAILEPIKGHRLNINSTLFSREGTILYLIAKHRRWKLLWEFLIGDYLDTERLGPLNLIHRAIVAIDLVGLKNAFDDLLTPRVEESNQAELSDLTAVASFLKQACRQDNILALLYFLQTPSGQAFSLSDIGVLVSQHGAKALMQFLVEFEPPHRYLLGKLYNAPQCLATASKYGHGAIIELLKPVILSEYRSSSRFEKVFRDPNAIEIMAYLLECGAKIRTHPKQSLTSFYLFPTQPEEACDNDHAETLALMLKYCAVNESTLLKRAKQRGCDKVIALLQERALSRESRVSVQELQDDHDEVIVNVILSDVSPVFKHP